MRITKLHTICMMTLSSILFVGFEASASIDPNMEAGVSCADTTCMFQNNPSISNEPVAKLQRLSLIKIQGEESEAKLVKVNRYEDNPAVKVVDRSQFPQFLPMNQIKRLAEVAAAKEGEVAGHGSGFNISPCLMVTNHHVVYGEDIWAQSAETDSLVISAGTKSGKTFAGSTKKNHVEVAGKRSLGGGKDWAVVKSPACLGKSFGWFEPSSKSALELVNEKPSVFVVSFPGDRDEGQLEVSFGKVTGFNQSTGNIEYNASTAPGSSGGAVFIIENGEMRFVGVHMGGDKSAKGYTFKTHTKEYSNSFVPAELFMQREDVKQMIALDKQYNGSENKAASSFRSIPNVSVSKVSGRLSI